MYYAFMLRNGEKHVFNAKDVSIRILPIKNGVWSVDSRKFRSFCERCYIYVRTPEHRFDLILTEVRLLDNEDDVRDFLNGNILPGLGRLKSNVAEKDWPEPPEDIKSKSSLPLNHPQALQERQI